jgi:hypothetical protein
VRPRQLNRYPASLFENKNVQRGLVIDLGGTSKASRTAPDGSIALAASELRWLKATCARRARSLFTENRLRVTMQGGITSHWTGARISGLLIDNGPGNVVVSSPG